VAEKNQEAGWWGARFDDARRRGFCVLMTAANYGTAWRSTTAPLPAEGKPSGGQAGGV